MLIGLAVLVTISAGVVVALVLVLSVVLQARRRGGQAGGYRQGAYPRNDGLSYLPDPDPYRQQPPWTDPGRPAEGHHRGHHGAHHGGNDAGLGGHHGGHSGHHDSGSSWSGSSGSTDFGGGHHHH